MSGKPSIMNQSTSLPSSATAASDEMAPPSYDSCIQQQTQPHSPRQQYDTVAAAPVPQQPYQSYGAQQSQAAFDINNPGYSRNDYKYYDDCCCTQSCRRNRHHHNAHSCNHSRRQCRQNNHCCHQSHRSSGPRGPIGLAFKLTGFAVSAPFKLARMGVDAATGNGKKQSAQTADQMESGSVEGVHRQNERGMETGSVGEKQQRQLSQEQESREQRVEKLEDQGRRTIKEKEEAESQGSGWLLPAARYTGYAFGIPS